ncbi:mitogen-activated protein kinase-binding protein 1-like, partial [Oncorhynchus nerka]|uniref:mitogen-activated protein kinase-binding protein 1-like n=1 Tax=Oncorhynchus nerka TaxID=8023 RepID=UPI0031B7F4B8
KGTVIASNKVSSRVLSVSFSGRQQLLGSRQETDMSSSGEQHGASDWPIRIARGTEEQHVLWSVVVGGATWPAAPIASLPLACCVSSNSRRMLDAWVDLKTTSARCLSVNEVFIFCGCADGTVRLFSPQNLHYITTLHRPHCLGVDVTQGLQPGHLFVADPKAEYPDTLALTFDPVTRHLTCVYNDHSVYVWDVRDIKNVGKVYSALYHSGCVWSLE